jgi:hypothetical protein
VLVDRADEGAHLPQHDRVERHDRLAVERDLQEAPPDTGADAAADGLAHALLAAAAGAGLSGYVV